MRPLALLGSCPFRSNMPKQRDEGSERGVILRKDIPGVADNGDVALGREPVQIGEAFLEGIPIVSEVRRKGEGAGPLCQKRLLCPTAMTTNTADDRSMSLMQQVECLPRRALTGEEVGPRPLWIAQGEGRPQIDAHACSVFSVPDQLGTGSPRLLM